MELEEIGKTLTFRKRYFDSWARKDDEVYCEVIMCIKAPRGMMQLYEPSMYYRGWTKQCEAIKAFMEEHNGS